MRNFLVFCDRCKANHEVNIKKRDREFWYDGGGYYYYCPNYCPNNTLDDEYMVLLYHNEYKFLKALYKHYQDEFGIGKKYDSLDKIFKGKCFKRFYYKDPNRLKKTYEF